MKQSSQLQKPAFACLVKNVELRPVVGRFAVERSEIPLGSTVLNGGAGQVSKSEKELIKAVFTRIIQSNVIFNLQKAI